MPGDPGRSDTESVIDEKVTRMVPTEHRAICKALMVGVDNPDGARARREALWDAIVNAVDRTTGRTDSAGASGEASRGQ